MTETIKKNILYVLILLTSLPFALILTHPVSWSLNSNSATDIALYLSSVFGYIGISYLLWMYILGTRSIAGHYFKDLAWTLKVHRLLGTYGVLFVFLHPFLSAYAYGESLLTYWVIPHISTEFQKDVTLGRIGFMALLIVWVTSALVRGQISYRPWKYIHYLSYIALPLGLLHLRGTGTSFHRPWVQVFYYSFVTIYIVMTLLRARHLFGFGKVVYEVSEHKEISTGVFLLKLGHPEKLIGIRTGQYVYVQRSLLSEEHPFSVVDFDNKTGEISIAYKVFGSFTRKLSAMPKGSNILVDGPYGVFTQEIQIDKKTPAVFIAGGIGITPFVKHVIERAPQHNTWVFYVNKEYTTATFRSLIKSLLGNKYIDVLSQDTSEAFELNERGRINETILKKYIQRPLECKYFICGPPPMMDAAREALIVMGIQERNIHVEEFSF
jgi:predicted ferric reductase